VSDRLSMHASDVWTCGEMGVVKADRGRMHVSCSAQKKDSIQPKADCMLRER
jgi:hypothetical protein